MSDEPKYRAGLTYVLSLPPTVRVSAEVHERLKLHAERLGITVEELVEQALANVGVN